MYFVTRSASISSRSLLPSLTGNDMSSRLILFLLLLFTGCSIIESDDATQLRIENASDVDFTSVFVAFPDAEAEYGAIATGQRSSYKRLDGAYRYGYIEVKAAGDTYVLQPIDFVGEEALDAGRYTYQLDVVEGNLTLSLE